MKHENSVQKRFLTSLVFEQGPKIVVRIGCKLGTTTNDVERTCEQVEVSVLRYEYSAFYDCDTSMKRLQYDHSTTVYDCCTATVLLPQGALYYD